ncbi:MAG: SUMF1/EgtB/PvdO family nonheme iron enzyme [Terricaulis sp.]
MVDVFISYKKERRAHAKRLAAVLETYGFEVWWDYDLLVGAGDYDTQIEHKLSAAKAVIVLWCSGSRASRFVKDEADRAVRAEKLLPALIEAGVDPPLGLGRAEMAHLLAWSGDPSAEGVVRLVEGVERLTKRSRHYRPNMLETLREAAALPSVTSMRLEMEDTNAPPMTPPFSTIGQGAQSQAPPVTPAPSGQSPQATTTTDFAEVPAGMCRLGFSQAQIDDVVRFTQRNYPHILLNSVAHVMARKEALVAIAKFAIGATPVTNAQYAEFAAATGYRTLAERKGADSWRKHERQLDHPVVYVSHSDARAFCQWRGGDLPTLEQWVRAFRGDDGRLYPWGEIFDPAKCNTRESYRDQTTTPVRQHSAGQSSFGCYDMVGNVGEWTATSDGGGFVLLGGSYADDCGVAGLPVALRVAAATYWSSDIGFRCVKAL